VTRNGHVYGRARTAWQPAAVYGGMPHDEVQAGHGPSIPSLQPVHCDFGTRQCRCCREPHAPWQPGCRQPHGCGSLRSANRWRHGRVSRGRRIARDCAPERDRLLSSRSLPRITMCPCGDGVAMPLGARAGGGRRGAPFRSRACAAPRQVRGTSRACARRTRTGRRPARRHEPRGTSRTTLRPREGPRAPRV
jgi:hypothetical protein